jgi:hypothetical protein
MINWGQIGGQVHFEPKFPNSFELILTFNLKLTIKPKFMSQ